MGTWHQDRHNFDFDLRDIVLRRQIEEKEDDVRWPPDCEDVSPGAEERPLLEAATKQSSEDLDLEHLSLCDSDI
jgi:hypothetical protein